MAGWKKVIVSGSTAELAGITLSGAVNAGTDTDKFLVLDSSGNVDFRTGAQVLSDIGAGAGSGDISSVVAGDGLTGGATTGDATLNVGAGDGISVAADAVAVDATVLRTTGGGVVSGSSQITMGSDLSGTANNVTVDKVKGVALESGEVTQLANIDSTTISSTQWGYVGALNQGLTTTSAVTFATVNTGQGANELYAMDQAVRTTDAVTFATVNTGQGANELYAMNQNVQTTDAVTFASVDTGQGANELYAMNQNVRSSDGVTFGSVTSDGSIIGKTDTITRFNFDGSTGITTIATASVEQNLTVGGDLIVNGDLTYLNTTNTAVEDQFILLGSGSTSADVGIIFQTGVTEGNAIGTAFFLDNGVSRLSYATAIAHDSTAVTPAAYIPLVFDVTGQGHTAVTDVGNIKIESGEAYIYV